MNSSLEKAKDLLLSEGYTCVLIKDDSIYTSFDRGVKPLMSWLNSNTNLQGYYVADKVIGKAAAFLYVLLGVKAIYAPVMSKHAVDVLKQHGIDVVVDEQVDAIRNRTNTGFCPMEQAVMNITIPEDAPKAIIEKLKELNK